MPRNVSLPIYFLVRQLISNTLLILTPQMAAFASFWTTKRGPLVTSSLKAPIFHWAPSPTSFFLEEKSFADLAPLFTNLRGAFGGRGRQDFGGSCVSSPERGLTAKARAGCSSNFLLIPDSTRSSVERKSDFFFVPESPRWTWRARGREPGAESLSQADGQPDGEGRGEGSPGRRAALDSGEGAARGRARSHRCGLQLRGCT